MLIFERKICITARIQISSFPYWHLNQLGHCDRHTDQETNLSLIQVSIPDSQECNMLLFAWEQSTSGYFSFGFTYISTSHLVLFDMNIENLYTRGHIDRRSVVRIPAVTHIFLSKINIYMSSDIQIFNINVLLVLSILKAYMLVPFIFRNSEIRIK